MKISKRKTASQKNSKSTQNSPAKKRRVERKSAPTGKESLNETSKMEAKQNEPCSSTPDNSKMKSDTNDKKPIRSSPRFKVRVDYNPNRRPSINQSKFNKKTAPTLKMHTSVHTGNRQDGKKQTDDKPKVYQLKITLLDTEPEIWRRIQVPEEYDFGSLGFAIKSAMGWVSCHHVHQFMAPNATGGTDYIRRPDEFCKDIIDEKTVKMADHFKKKGDRVIYMYTFGEGWEHMVQLEEILPRTANKAYPQCLDGKRACPLEEIGGVEGHQHLLEILKDRKHPEREDYMDWIKEFSPFPNYKPERFNLKDVQFEMCPIYWGSERKPRHF